MDNSSNSNRFKSSMAALILLFSLLFMAGCTSVATKPPQTADNTLTACRALFQEVDTIVDNAGVRDHGAVPVQGFPYLRTTRLLASFRNELIGPLHWSAWISHMAELDAEARALELRNLPDSATKQSKDRLHDELNNCREYLIAADLTQPEHRVRLSSVARVPDDYVTWWQVLGLYPLTAPMVAVGIASWQNETRATFATPLASLPVAGRLVRWAPASVTPATTKDAALPDAPLSARQISDILHRSLDPLGIPLPADTDLDRLFGTFAPIWEVDVIDDNDRIGGMRWENGPDVDITRPTLYRKVSHTRFGNQVLLQLNYIIWFRARPGRDIYAGQLDGIKWRVTLGMDGKPLLYDAIHNCGCYHKFFLSQQLRLRKDLPVFFFEPPLLPQPAPEQQPLILRIAHHTHYIQRLYHDQETSAGLTFAAQPNQSMTWEAYDALRSLPTTEGYRSLFGPHGLITESERSERFLLWPMGVRSPGAMRQWGRHATAFVGRRHFDDAFLIESLFQRLP